MNSTGMGAAFLAGVFKIIGSLGTKLAARKDNFMNNVILICGIVISLSLLIYAMESLSLSTAYPIWPALTLSAWHWWLSLPPKKIICFIYNDQRRPVFKRINTSSIFALLPSRKPTVMLSGVMLSSVVREHEQTFYIKMRSASRPGT